MEPTSTNAPPAKAGGRLVLIAVLGLAVLVVAAGAGWWLRDRWTGTPASPPPTNPTPQPRTDALYRGETIYKRQCVGCHGEHGRGDGSKAASLTTPPGDFALGLCCGSDAAAVRRVIVDGVPGTAMIGVGKHLSADDLDAVTAYVLKLAEALRPVMEQAGLKPVAVRAAAPELELRDAEGKASDLAQHRGRLVLLVFWETTCVPCLEKMPRLAGLAEEFRDHGVDVVAVCVNPTDADTLLRLSAAHFARLPAYRDGGGTARRLYDISSVPRVCLIDHEGRLVAAGDGPADWNGAEIRQLLRACLGRSGGQ
jgi:mono/diheme cytochrome c family protein